ncbi:hypothetical protein F5X68DRAFT_195393 [Plectosphaerella plurivora]|uniref:Amidohydrolase-related domain-containing protein n=1 Tax=Plectosphaerella plurivora TaxID=936078 RepID=A0A9P8V2C8_9PEZI|nr:hypothetical protein F5X68DRAFT_195393 [Plectosphaerella plurivora]
MGTSEHYFNCCGRSSLTAPPRPGFPPQSRPPAPSVASWDDFSAFQDNTPAPSPMTRTLSVRPQQPEVQESKFTCIFADLLIPGRGSPVNNAVIGISLADGTISFVGPQSGDIPPELASAPRTHVRCLMPGLWDCHIHYSGIINVDTPLFCQTHPAYMGAAITRGLHETLMGGVTSVRDLGSLVAEVLPLLDAGILLGPNVYAAGAVIGMTSGGCDPTGLPATQVYSTGGVDHHNAWPGTGIEVIADGPEELRRAVRLQVRRGAKCIKVLATGSVLGASDDPEDREFSDAELKAAIDEAKLRRRAVAAHAHGKEGMLSAIRAGAASIEHGSYLDDEVADLMIEHGTTLVATRNVIEAGLLNLDKLTPPTARKMVHLAGSHAKGYATAVRKGVKIALGTDICSAIPDTPMAHGSNAREVVWAVEVGGLTPLQAIEAGTINSAEILGPQTPKKGLIKVGWDADLIALDFNPLEDIRVFMDRDSIRHVWKGGDLVKAPGFVKIWPSPKPK